LTSIIPIQCLACSRLQRTKSTCDAFPDGIPTSILSGADHRVSVPGDGGKLFLLRNDAKGKRAFADWQLVFGESQE